MLGVEKRFSRFVSSCLLMGLVGIAVPQSAVPVGHGSYASSVPTIRLNDDGYFAPTPGTIINEFATLYLDPSLKSRAVPTNQWWTDLMIGQRSRAVAGAPADWFQQQMDGAGNAGVLHALPGAVQPTRRGMNLFFPKDWVRNDLDRPSFAQGNFDQGPALQIENYTGFQLPADDTMLGDFGGTTYPSGWVASGDLVGTAPIQGGSWPNQSPPVTGLIGNACINTYRGTDTTQGTLTSPEFTISSKYIVVKSGGGNDPQKTSIQLVIDGAVVASAIGQQDAMLRWTKWDLTAQAGKRARLVIRDSSSGGWGFTLCAAIIGTNSAEEPETRYSTTLTVPSAMVTGYSDWSVDFRQSNSAAASADTTVARGIPFVWTRYSNVSPRINVGATPQLTDTNGNAISTTGGSFRSAAFCFNVVDSRGMAHTYAVFAPDNTNFKLVGNWIEADRPGYLVYGFLPDSSFLNTFRSYAFARPTKTTYGWSYSPSTGSVSTTWQITAAPLKGTSTATLQGWLPHHYRTTSRAFAMFNTSYTTVRGKLLLAAGNNFTLKYPFRGIAPVLPAPTTKGIVNDYSPARMSNYLGKFADSHPTIGADTYWQGKEFGLSAQYLSLASQSNDPATTLHLQSKLRTYMSDWLTYTPGEEKNFFATYPGWQGLVGFYTGYGSSSFNDLHFHYGYYAVGAALLGMHDSAFLTQYGPMMRLVAKQYANWDRADTQFPFLRTFDVWEGHGWAAGVSGPGGNNQESSSEAMNAWVGMFLLGSLLGDDAMRDCGAMGYAVESASTNEYWQDWRGTNFPVGYGPRMTGILTDSGIAYATYFSGDPAWIYGIQWTPANHWNNYLARNLRTATLQYSQLWRDRAELSEFNAKRNPGGFRLSDSNTPAGLGAYPGAYVLGFESLINPTSAVAKLDQYWNENLPIATDQTHTGAVYYVAHALRGLGQQDWDSHTSIPTSQVFRTGSGVRTFVIYNPKVTAQTATLYVNGATVGSVRVPARTTISTTATSGGTALSTPYFGVPVRFPAALDLVNFDFGGEGVSYHDLDSVNVGGEYRPSEAVDIATVSLAGNRYRVFGTAPNQWKNYTIQIARAGTYQATFYVGAATAGKSFRVRTPGGTTLATVAVPNTGSEMTFAPVTVNLTLPAGTQVLRIQEDSAGFSLLRVVVYATGAAADIPVGREISLKAQLNGMYVAAEDAGNQPLVANRGGAAGWEKFTVVGVRTGVVALRATANGKYVTLAASDQLIANSASIGAAQEFEWIDLGNGDFALKYVATGKYVSVPGSSTPLVVNATAIGNAETFRALIHP